MLNHRSPITTMSGELLTFSRFFDSFAYLLQNNELYTCTCEMQIIKLTKALVKQIGIKHFVRPRLNLLQRVQKELNKYWCLVRLPCFWFLFSPNGKDILQDFFGKIKVKNFMKLFSLKLSNNKIFHKSPCFRTPLKTFKSSKG